MAHLCCLFSIPDCGGLSHPDNGVVNFPFGTTYGEAVIYTCNPGYELIGKDTRVCRVTTQWSGMPPICSVKGNLLWWKPDINKTIKKNKIQYSNKGHASFYQ